MLEGAYVSFISFHKHDEDGKTELIEVYIAMYLPIYLDLE